MWRRTQRARPFERLAFLLLTEVVLYHSGAAAAMLTNDYVPKANYYLLRAPSVMLTRRQNQVDIKLRFMWNSTSGAALILYSPFGRHAVTT